MLIVELLVELQSKFQCGICYHTVKNPKICRICKVIVGCELCVQKDGQKAVVINGETIKEAGKWVCPRLCGNTDDVCGDQGTLEVHLDLTFLKKYEEELAEDDENWFVIERVNM